MQRGGDDGDGIEELDVEVVKKRPNKDNKYYIENIVLIRNESYNPIILLLYWFLY